MDKSIKKEGNEIDDTNKMDIETQEKDLLENTKEEEMSIEKNTKSTTEEMTLPKGHGKYEGKDISECPFFKISQKAKNRKKKEEEK